MAFQNPYSARLQEFSSFAFNQENSRETQLEWEAFFQGRLGRSPEKIILEIGCSNAGFLCEIAKSHPKAAFIGLDWKYKIIFKGAKRTLELALLNVALLRARAQGLRRMFGPGILDEIWIFFPDPWAKKGQLKNRLICEAFLLEAWAILKPGGRIFFKTDHPGYFQWVLSLFGQPQPSLPSYDMLDPVEKSYRNKMIKVRRVESDLPIASEPLKQKFSFDLAVVDYWKQPHPETFFSNTQTLFERSFVKEDLPIYYIELTACSSHLPGPLAKPRQC